MPLLRELKLNNSALNSVRDLGSRTLAGDATECLLLLL